MKQRTFQLSPLFSLQLDLFLNRGPEKTDFFNKPQEFFYRSLGTRKSIYSGLH